MTKRRKFLQGSLTGAAAAVAAFGINPALAQEMAKVAGRSDKPLRLPSPMPACRLRGAHRENRQPNTGASCSTWT